MCPTLPVLRARSEPGTARWVPCRLRATPSPNAGSLSLGVGSTLRTQSSHRVEHEMTLANGRWDWGPLNHRPGLDGRVGKAGHALQAASQATRRLPGVHPPDSLDPFDAEPLRQRRRDVEAAAGHDRSPGDHLGQDSGAMTERDEEPDVAGKDGIDDPERGRSQQHAAICAGPVADRLCSGQRRVPAASRNENRVQMAPAVRPTG